MRNDDWSRYEDGQPAPGGMISNWTSEEKFTWHMEVREWLGTKSMQMGTLHIIGSFDGSLKIGVRTPFHDLEGLS